MAQHRDDLKSRELSKEGQANWDNIFGKNIRPIQVVFDDVNIGRSFWLEGTECKKLDSVMYYVYSTGDKLSTNGSTIVEVRA